MSRFDAYGLFWEDQPRVSTRGTGTEERVPRTPPPVPDTGWSAPFEFPRLEAAKRLVIDVETYDPRLLTHGPGWATGDGHVVGIAVGTEDAQWYFPMRHEYGGGNMDAEMVLRWAREELTRASQPKIGANLMYDIGWLRREGVHVKGECWDVQFAEPLLDEHAFTYALGALAQKYLNETKNEDTLYDWLHRAYGGAAGRKQAANIHRSPVALCGPYAESDVDLPLRILEKQIPLLQSEGVFDLFRLECGLIPLLVDMRWNGVRVDVAAAERTRDAFALREVELQQQLDTFSGRKGFRADAPSDMKAAFDRIGLVYPRTEQGNPSFTKSVLEALDHPFTNAIKEMRRLTKARGTFIEGYVLDKHCNGRIHAEFHPLRKDDAGTVSGRFSSSNPNLQNIPSRDDEMKHLVRGLFLPEEGHRWFAPDYSQIEYRIMTHYAVGSGAEEARQRYRDNPKTDYHVYTQDLVQELVGKKMDRKPIKNINFGIIFGMGEPKIKAILGADGAAVLTAYHEALPFVKETLKTASTRATNRGFIRTLGGRKARHPFWECSKYMSEKDKEAVCKQKNDPKWFNFVGSREEAIAKWGSAKRAMSHKALNELTQGSAADLIKKAMLLLYQQGYPTPLVQVHDELGFSLPYDDAGKQCAAEITHIMSSAQELKVPVLVDGDWGDTWGDC